MEHIDMKVTPSAFCCDIVSVTWWDIFRLLMKGEIKEGATILRLESEEDRTIRLEKLA